MTKEMKDRLTAIEQAEQDGQGEFLFVAEQTDGRFRDAHTSRTYTAERLQAIHDARPELVIINQGGPGAATLPPHPAGNPQGWTLNDIRFYDELRSKQQSGGLLTSEEDAFLVTWDSERSRVQAAHDTWEDESQPQFAEAVRRVERLNARAQRR